jgi:3-hydroxyacyl-CoA dehydrogenase
MKKVGIIGAGTMGPGIAQCFAVKGYFPWPEEKKEQAVRERDHLLLRLLNLSGKD